jgi:hypothetical protein
MQERAGLTVESPVDGAMVLKRRVRFAGAAPGHERIKLGGESVEVSTDGRWAAHVELADGAHEVTATAVGEEDVTVAFVVDTQAPEILLESPQRGLFHLAGDGSEDVAFRGAVWDAASGVAKLTIDGEPVEFDGKGGFEHLHTPAEGLSTVLIVATDGAGRTAQSIRSILSGQFAPAGDPVADAVEIVVDGPTLQQVADGIEELVQEQAVDALVRQGGGGDFEVRDVSYSRLEIDLVPDHGGFRVTIRIYGLRIDVRIKQKILFATITMTGHANADPAEMTGFISMTVTSDGRVDMALQNPEISLHGFRFDINNFPGALEGWFRGMVRDFAEDVIGDALRSLVFPELFDPADLVQELKINDKVITLDIRLQLLTISPDGMLIRARTQASSESASVVAPNPGRYLTKSPAAPAGEDSPVRITMSDDAINQILHTVWLAGGLDVVGDLPAAGDAPLSLDVKGLGDLFGGDLTAVAPADALLEIALKPLLPPVWIPAEPGGENLATLGLADCFLSFLAVVPEGPSIPLVAISFAAYFDIGLPPSPGEAAPIVGAVIHTDLFGEAVDLDDERVEEVLGRLLTLVAPMVSGALDGVDPPDAGGVGQGDATLSSDGAGVVVDVRPAP